MFVFPDRKKPLSGSHLEGAFLLVLEDIGPASEETRVNLGEQDLGCAVSIQVVHAEVRKIPPELGGEQGGFIDPRAENEGSPVGVSLFNQRTPSHASIHQKERPVRSRERADEKGKIKIQDCRCVALAEFLL